MKKIITLAAALVLVTGASAQSSWRMGVTLGAFGNHSQFSGGMQNASALFTQNPYSTGGIGVLFRKTLNSHLSFQTGLNFGSLGFEYGMAGNYNLTHPFSHYSISRASAGTVAIPATLIWNFNPNCKNVRWFVGGGLSLVRHGDFHSNDPATVDIGPNITNGYFKQTVTNSSTGALNGHVMGGVEKLLKKGGMISLALYLNRGFAPLATSNVIYMVDNTVYNHSFRNFNNYAGLTLTYYFKNFKGGVKPAAVAR